MKTALILTIRHDSWLIPNATPTDAGKLLALFGKAVKVDRDYERGNTETWKVDIAQAHPDYHLANPKIQMVPLSKIRMPAEDKDEATRANRAKPVKALGSTPILRLEGGKS